MHEIQIDDPVSVLSGDRQGDVGKVLAIDRKQRTHFTYRCYHVLFPDGAVVDFEGTWARTDKGKEFAKPLNIEAVVEEKPTDGMTPPKPEPPEIVILREDQTKVPKPKEENRHAREA